MLNILQLHVIIIVSLHTFLTFIYYYQVYIYIYNIINYSSSWQSAVSYFFAKPIIDQFYDVVVGFVEMVVHLASLSSVLQYWIRFGHPECHRICNLQSAHFSNGLNFSILISAISSYTLNRFKVFLESVNYITSGENVPSIFLVHIFVF